MLPIQIFFEVLFVSYQIQQRIRGARGPCPPSPVKISHKEGMLFSIVPRLGNTWFLLCLEQLDADWLNGCVCLEALHSDCFYCMWYLLCLEILHSDCFCCMWYCYHPFSLDECPSPAGGRIFCFPCFLIG